MNDVYCFILAGGVGGRLEPLTLVRAKPAVPFGGKYRLIDIVLSNTWHSELRKLGVLTMVDPRSLEDHIANVWKPHYTRGEFINWMSPPQRGGIHFYSATADAVYQNMRELQKEEDVKDVLVLGSDHVYKMDYREYRAFHNEKGADLTVSAIPADFNDDSNYDSTGKFKFGIFSVDENGKVIQFIEKPEKGSEIFEQIEMKDNPGHVLASMGIYFFNKESLEETLEKDHDNTNSTHDFGRDIVPGMVRGGHPVYAYDFTDNSQAKANKNYWRDVGTIKHYFDANLDLIQVVPDFDLHSLDWRIFGKEGDLPPTKYNFSNGRQGHALESLVCEGCIVSGEFLKSIVGPYVRLEENSYVDNSVVSFGARIGANVKMHNTIVEKKAVVPNDVSVGFDHEYDKARGLFVKDGITIVPSPFLPEYKLINWHK